MSRYNNVNELDQWCPTFFVPRSTLQGVTIPRSTSPVLTSQTHTRRFQLAATFDNSGVASPKFWGAKKFSGS